MIGSAYQEQDGVGSYPTLKAANYRGWNGAHTFARYVEVYQEAFNALLADLGEVTPESKKVVTDFLSSILDPIC
jgi:hypothetical protein